MPTAGGTDIISCFAGSNPVLPVYRGEIQARNLAMAMECWNEDGMPYMHVCSYKMSVCAGQPVMDCDGELVCVKPFPSQPTHFWNDEDGIKYTKAYFSMFKGMWVSTFAPLVKLLSVSPVLPASSLPPDVWAHGDYCNINSETGGIVMLGRRSGRSSFPLSLSPSLPIIILCTSTFFMSLSSDGTLNPSGVRFGSAEIYNIGVCVCVCV